MIELQILRRVEGQDGEPVGALDAEIPQTADQAADSGEVFRVGRREPGGNVGRQWPISIVADRGQQQPVVNELLHANRPANGTLSESIDT